MATQALTIDANTTREELETAFLVASTYDNPDDSQKAKNYITAGRALLTLPLAEVEHGGERVRVEPRLIQEGVAKAEKWLAMRNLLRPVSYAPARDWRE